MNEDVIFYHNPQSRAQIAHWMLEEVGAPYRIVPMTWEGSEHKQPEFLAINPMGKVPAIVHRGVVVTETPAVIAYLADAFPMAGLAPDMGSPERGAYYRWLFFAAGCIEPAMVDAVAKRPAPENRTASGYGSAEDVLATLKGVLAEREWLVGDRFSAADLYVGAALNWMGLFEATGIKGEPVFDAYVARATARPAYARTRTG